MEWIRILMERGVAHLKFYPVTHLEEVNKY
jgi:hypothetical protein